MLVARCNDSFQRHCEPTGRANARPMTGSAKQSIEPHVKTRIASSLALLAMTETSSFRTRHQRRVAAGGGRVDGYGLFGRKARQVMRPARFRARARQPLTAERLHADHRPDHVAVDIDVADRKPVDHAIAPIVDAG